jgi:hypothetical protein
MAYVYKHIRKDTNEVFYIGISNGDSGNYTRATDRNKRNLYWKRIVDKVGFYYEIIEDNISWETACELEKYWIKYYGRHNLKEGNLVNMTDGGEGASGFHHTEKHKQYIKDWMCKPKTIQWRKNIAIARTGTTASDETKKKMSKSQIGNTNAKTKAIMIDGIEYKSGVMASKILGINPVTICDRLRNPRFQNYFYKN